MDRELLSAISDMMDEKLHPIKMQIGELYGMKEDVQGLKQDVQVLKEDMQEVKGRVKKIELTQENVILPRLQNIEECYVTTYERYQKNCDEHEEMKQDIAMLKEVVEKHSQILQRIS